MHDETIPHQSQNNTPVSPSQPKPSKSEGWRSMLSTILILIAAPVVALLLTAFVFQSYEVDGPSMEPTLENKDRLIVLKVPRTFARLTRNDYIPHRGDIIVFTKHNLQEYGDTQPDKQLIKRVIGLPGDRVVVQGGTITIYNHDHPSGFDPDQEAHYVKTAQITSGNVDTTVAVGEVFVTGDNRANSLDSRFFGTVRATDIVGKLVFRIFPLGQAQSF
jgi:signal peptidase I